MNNPFASVNRSTATTGITSFLSFLLSGKIPASAENWLKEQADLLQKDLRENNFLIAFSIAPRVSGRQLIEPDDHQILEAQMIREGWSCKTWSAAQAVRTILLLSLFQTHPEKASRIIHRFLETASVEEQSAFYAALPLLPEPYHFTEIARQGIRSNITDVFDTIALDNPFPADYLDEAAWNQMVLKALFMNRPLFRIFGIDRRANYKLAIMLSDYAHERWAAGRKVSPELWRPVAPFLDKNNLADIKKIISGEDKTEQYAGILACMHSVYPPARKLADHYKELKKEIEEKNITWDLIGECTCYN